jgi:hypothetical protein
MDAAHLLIQAQAAGIEFIPLGDRLRVRAPQRPPDDLLEALRARKAELLALLDSRPGRHAYRFKLHNGDGGTFITDTPSLEAARAELATRYSDRLALVVPT